MTRAGRIAGAVAVGAAVWAILWNLGNRAALGTFPDVLVPDEPLRHPGFLTAYIAYGALLSVLAGRATAAVGAVDATLAVRVLAGLQLSLGVVAEASYWSLMPVWYHLVFLASIVPATLLGGRLRRDRVSADAG